MYGMECTACGTTFENEDFDMVCDWDCTCGDPVYQAYGNGDDEQVPRYIERVMATWRVQICLGA